jgi:uncharacterized protein
VIVDALAVVGPNLFRPGSARLDELVVTSRALGVDAVVVAPGRPSGYALPPANDALFAAASRWTGSVARLARVDPWQGEAAVQELRRCLTELECVGLFLHPGEEAFRVQETIPLAREAERHGAPIVVASGLYGLSEPLQVLEVAQAVPSVPVVMTSGGQINISGLSMIDAWAALRRSPNLHVLTNGEYRQDFLEQLASELDPRRLLFASFAPYYEPDFELRRARSARFSDEARALVLGANAERVFHLDARDGT